MRNGMRINLEIMLLCAVFFIPSALAENVPVYNEIPLNYPWTGYRGEYNGNSALKIDTTWAKEPESGTYCASISYDRTKEQWAGLFIQGDGTWNRGPGIGLNLAEAKKLVFYARGKVGQENVAFGYGYDSPDQSGYTDSSYANRMITLTRGWQRYEFDLSDKDLSHINGLFMFSVDKFNNPSSVTFYLDDIAYV
jgi:hypothetical protein